MTLLIQLLYRIFQWSIQTLAVFALAILLLDLSGINARPVLATAVAPFLTGESFTAAQGNNTVSGHTNFQPTEKLKTPEHIKPLWYMRPFYNVLHLHTGKLEGTTSMLIAVLLSGLIALMPLLFLFIHVFRGENYNVFPHPRALLTSLTGAYLLLLVLGIVPTTYSGVILLSAIGYFAFCFLLPYGIGFQAVAQQD